MNYEDIKHIESDKPIMVFTPYINKGALGQIKTLTQHTLVLTSYQLNNMPDEFKSMTGFKELYIPLEDIKYLYIPDEIIWRTDNGNIKNKKIS